MPDVTNAASLRNEPVAESRSGAIAGSNKKEQFMQLSQITALTALVLLVLLAAGYATAEATAETLSSPAAPVEKSS
jgi:hypothetical protein